MIYANRQLELSRVVALDDQLEPGDFFYKGQSIDCCPTHTICTIYDVRKQRIGAVKSCRGDRPTGTEIPLRFQLSTNLTIDDNDNQSI